MLQNTLVKSILDMGISIAFISKTNNKNKRIKTILSSLFSYPLRSWKNELLF